MFTEGLTVTIEEDAPADAPEETVTTTTVTASAVDETAGAEPSTVSLASISGGLAAVAEAVAETTGGVAAAAALASVEGSVISDDTSAAGDGETVRPVALVHMKDLAFARCSFTRIETATNNEMLAMCRAAVSHFSTLISYLFCAHCDYI
jgi:hypothetical protein